MHCQHFARYTLAGAFLLTGATLADVNINPPPVDMMVMNDSVASPGTIRASKLIDSEVYDPAGKDVGRIDDIVIDRTYTTIDYTVVHHGLTGLGDKLLAMPYKALALGGPSDKRVYVQVPLDVVQRAPGFDERKWPTEATVDYYRSLDTYYSTHLAAAAGQKPDLGEEAQLVSGAIEPAALLWTRRIESLRGRDVLSPSGEKLGSIKDLVIAARSGDIRYAVLAHADGQPGAEYYAVPLSRFRFDPRNQKLVLDVSADQLKQIPSFDKDHWPAQPDPRWTTPPVKDEMAPPQ